MTDTKFSTNPVCGDCVHCMAGIKTQDDIMARSCYRNPPSVIGVLTAQGIAVVSAYPEIRVDTPACGEYEEPEEVDPPTANPGLTS